MTTSESNEPLAFGEVGTDVPAIGLDVPVQEHYSTYMERYFTPRYTLDVHSKGDDMCVLFHSNRVCLITLAPSHPVLAQQKKVVKVDFEASESEEDLSHLKRKHRNRGSNRMDLKVRGKKKKGAQVLHRRSLLCNVECDDGTVFSIRSGIPGLLVEINEMLIENPNLLTEKPCTHGYVAILLPKTLQSDRLKDKLMTPEQYKKALEDREKGEEVKPTEESCELVQDEQIKTYSNLAEPNDKASDEEVKMDLDKE